MKNIIDKSGLSIKQFAHLYNIPYNTVRQWYNGTRKAPIYIKEMIFLITALRTKGKQLSFEEKIEKK